MLRRQDLHIASKDFTIRIFTLKYGKWGSAPRISLRRPFPTLPDPVHKLQRKLKTSASGPIVYLFLRRSSSAPITAAAFRASLHALVANVRPMYGTECTARSLRSEGVSAAYALRVRLETIIRLLNHTSSEVLHKNYPNTLFPATPAARVILGASRPLLVVCYPPNSLYTGQRLRAPASVIDLCQLDHTVFTAATIISR